MTLDAFVKKHPGCRVGRPSLSFPLGIVAVCAGVVALMLRMLIDAAFRDETPQRALLGPIGAVCLSFSCFAGAVIGGKRLLEVWRWRRLGRSSFAVADDEALLVDEDGQSVLIPIAQVQRLKIHIQTVSLSMLPGFARQDTLDRVVSRVLSPTGDGPGGRRFFQAIEPRVRQLAPQAEIRNVEPESLWSLIKNA